MRAGKDKRKAIKTESINFDEEEKKFDNKYPIFAEQPLIKSDKAQENVSLFPAFQVVIKDGKPVIETSNKDQSEMRPEMLRPVLIEHSKPIHVTSMSFKKKNHTKQWTPEETRKFYKVCFTIDLSTKFFTRRLSYLDQIFP